MPLLGTVIVAYAGLDVVHGLNGTQEAILRRELQFVRLAKIRVTASATMTVVAPSLAWVGFGVWSLVAEHAAGELARAALVWGPYRTWRPRWQWSREAARGFWGFGTRLWAGHNLSFLLHNFDDFWIGTALGSVALGFYSRAFDFGRYAERVFANPLLVTFPSLARLQRDRLRLSQSFFRITSVVVRSNAAAALVLILAAPEGARLAFGERWLPMVAPFQLLVLSALLGLVGHVAEEVFLAVGRPEVLVRIRALRLSLFLPGVILLGSFHGITGVALAGVLATLLGIGLVFHLVRQRVDYSPAKLFLWPTIAFVVVASSVLSTSSLWTGPLWLAVAGKAVVALVGYGVILVAAEREELATGYRFVRRFLSSDRVDDAGTDPGKG
jgi:O-antigen/teichoic acid export membrane protein